MIDTYTLLRTKLYPPEPQACTVARPGLIARLSEGLQLGRRLSLVCAPAGYGKTTLVRQWLSELQIVGRGLNAEGNERSQGHKGAHEYDEYERPVISDFGWLTLDESDNDIAHFLGYVTAALQQAEGNTTQPLDAVQTIQAKLGAVPTPHVTTLATALVNAMDRTTVLSFGHTPAGDTVRTELATGPLVLVLDDYQHIQARAVHQLVEFLVEHAPPRFHLVITTREDPPFALSRLRVRGQLTEIREADLRFTTAEAARFLHNTMPLGLSDEEVATLTARTEGWIAGLQLAGLSLRDRAPKDRESFLQAFSGSNRYIIDYLVDEVLRRQPDEMRRFLCQTSVLDRLCASLCDAVTDREDSREVLTHLEQANLFVIPLDDRREWYRYHGLFADCLATQLRAQSGEQERLNLHRKAARWLEEARLPAEAARHALAAGDHEHAAALVGTMAPGLMARGELRTLLGWLDALPPELMRDNLELAMYRAWTLFLTGRLREVADVLRPVRARLTAETDPQVRARLLVLLSWLTNFEEDNEASAQMAAEALTLISGEESLLTVLALDLLGEAQVRLGAGPAATQSFREGIALAERLNQPFAAIAILYNHAMELERQGQLKEALSLCAGYLQRYSDPTGRPLPVATQLYIPFAWMCYETNDLEQARDYLGKYLRTESESPGDIARIGLSAVLLVDAPWLQTNLELAMGDGERALATARQAAQAGREIGHKRVAYIMDACEAHIELAVGRVEAATRWAVEAGLWGDPASLPPDPARERVDLLLAELLLATGRAHDARALLANLERSAQAGHRWGRLIRIHLLQSAAELAASSESGAVSYLQRAIELAAPEGYIRAFLDEGAAMAELLPRLRNLDPACSDFVDVLIQASAGVKHVAGDARTIGPALAHDLARGDARNRQLDEPLSEQEMRILRLLAAPMTNQEVAGELVVTVGTVKWHLHNIYGKLGVESRTQAVARARRLGLLA